MTQIQVGVALPRREEREAVMAALERAGMTAESLVEACHVDSEIARQGFGCLVADGALLASGYLANIRKRDPRVPIVALVDAAQADDAVFRRVSVVTRPCDAADVVARVDLAFSESRQARRRNRTRTPRVPSRLKAVGRECRTARPCRALVAQAACSTRWMSPSDTARPPTGVFAE